MSEKREKSKTMDMTSGAVLPQIVRFAIPLLLSTLFQQFYNLADTMVVSYNLGGSAIAAVGATSVIYTLLVYIAYGMNSGFGIAISRAFGAKDECELRKTVATMIVLNILIAAVLTIASLLFARNLMVWLNTPTDIFDQAYTYIFIVLAGLSTTVLYNLCASFLRAVGNSVMPLVILIVSCVLNLGMDVLFIAGLHTGVGGAAMATVIAEGISGVLSGIYILRHYRSYLPHRSDFKLERERTREMFTTGLSMALMLSVFQIGSIILQRAINELGTIILTAHTASRKIFDLLMLPLNTIATANATFVSQNYGAGKLARIREGMRKTFFLEIGWFGISMIAAFPFGTAMMRLISNSSDPVILSSGLLYLRMGVLFFVPLGILFIVRTTMQSMGHKMAPVISSSMELAIKIIASYIVVPSVGYLAVALTEPVSWCLCAAYVSILFFLTIRKKLK